MILHRIDEDRCATEVLQNGRHVTVQGIAHAIMKHRRTALGAEDEMNVQPGERLWHWVVRPFRAFSFNRYNPRALPWAKLKRAVGAENAA